MLEDRLCVARPLGQLWPEGGRVALDCSPRLAESAHVAPCEELDGV